MAEANVRGVNIRYQVLGEHGPWVALSPGGRRGMDGVLSLGGKLADGGHRVLLHDRRNCGASDVIIDGAEAEFEIWADELHPLMGEDADADLAIEGWDLKEDELAATFVAFLNRVSALAAV